MAITLQDHTLEVAPFDGITRFRFKGSSDLIGVLSQRLPCVPLVNNEVGLTSTSRKRTLVWTWKQSQTRKYANSPEEKRGHGAST